MPTGFGAQLRHLSVRVMFSGRPAFAGCWRSVMSTTACCGVGSGGGAASAVYSDHSASWTSGSPSFAVMSSR